MGLPQIFPHEKKRARERSARAPARPMTNELHEKRTYYNVRFKREILCSACKTSHLGCQQFITVEFFQEARLASLIDRQAREQVHLDVVTGDGRQIVLGIHLDHLVQHDDQAIAVVGIRSVPGGRP